MFLKRLFLQGFIGAILLNQPFLMSSQLSSNENQKQQNTADVSKKIKAFLGKESKNLSETSPFLLRLFKDGVKDSNPAGLRISESVKQFASLNKFPACQRY